ncbi:LysR family transcriptional regulator [Photobacterium rosenbergii]|uniref:LysR family transcriptional regulator n=1 Tax=Photobacterium rosenbergii TaxID=294936 RepID=UPI001C999506|nr:LysR family transcriptional regulator [Photobacterium rosenbergii]MBY5948433.1 LysR family transcriptional regulator [Photobacterium rosenbergii]
MDKYKNMQLFCTVVEKGSFAKAAKAIGVTPAIVGRRIADLENDLGFVLLNRTTRSMQLTPGGKDYYQGAKRIVEDIDRLEDSLSSDHQHNPSGLIRLSAPDGLGPMLLEAIRVFRQSYPNIRFDIMLSNSQTNLIEEEIDLSFRLSFDLQDSSYIATKLGTSTFGLFASPLYLESNGRPEHFSELENHDCIHMGSSRYGDAWNLHVDGKNITYRQPWAMVVSSTTALIQALVSGMGIGVVPTLFAREYVEQKKLSALPGLTQFPEVGIYGMYPTRKHMPYRMTLFLGFLKAWFEENVSE